MANTYGYVRVSTKDQNEDRHSLFLRASTRYIGSGGLASLTESGQRKSLAFRLLHSDTRQNNMKAIVIITKGIESFSIPLLMPFSEVFPKTIKFTLLFRCFGDKNRLLRQEFFSEEPYNL